MMRANNMRVVLGSALLWAWGFLCFLSPALFPERGGLDASIGLEYGFFASQASVLVCAGVVVLVSRWRRFIVKRGAFFVAALLVALTTLVLTWAVRADALAVIVACGVIDGGAVMLLGVAWGARYSLGSQRMRSLVVLSWRRFLVLRASRSSARCPWRLGPCGAAMRSCAMSCRRRCSPRARRPGKPRRPAS